MLSANSKRLALEHSKGECKREWQISNGSKARREKNLDGIESEPASINLIDDPFTPLDQVVADIWMFVLDVCSHWTGQEKCRIELDR